MLCSQFPFKGGQRERGERGGGRERGRERERQRGERGGRERGERERDRGEREGGERERGSCLTAHPMKPPFLLFPTSSLPPPYVYFPDFPYAMRNVCRIGRGGGYSMFPARRGRRKRRLVHINPLLLVLASRL